jgi:hypothetical protein
MKFLEEFLASEDMMYKWSLQDYWNYILESLSRYDEKN